MDKYDERLQQITERTLTARFSLWAALLTAHTVMLSVSVALLVTAKHIEVCFFKLCGFIAICCMIAVLLNFWLTKSQYEQIGRRTAEPEAELSESERKRDLRQALTRRRFNSIFEIVAFLGLFAEALLFGWVLAAS